MFLIILLSPLVFLACFALPFVGTVFSKEHSSKWIAFWILQIAASWTVIPFLGLIFECEVQMVAKILIALALIFVLNPALVLLSSRRSPPSTSRSRESSASSTSRSRTSSSRSPKSPNNMVLSNDLNNYRAYCNKLIPLNCINLETSLLKKSVNIK